VRCAARAARGHHQDLHPLSPEGKVGFSPRSPHGRPTRVLSTQGMYNLLADERPISRNPRKGPLLVRLFYLPVDRMA
jgi:hypothetical protein